MSKADLERTGLTEFVEGTESSQVWRQVRRVVIFLIFLAVLSRLTYLGNRAFHHDESLDAWFSLQYLDGTYKGYDPVYHGPLRFYITAGFFWIFGQSDEVARLLPALSGIVVAALPWVWRRNLGPIGTLTSVGLIVISPTMLYFSRFGREDTFFLALTFLTVLTFFAFLNNPKRWHPLAVLILLVLALAVKESVFLTVFIFGSFGMIVFAQDLILASQAGSGGMKKRKPIYEEAVREITIEEGHRRSIMIRTRVLQEFQPRKVKEEKIRRFFLVGGLLLLLMTFWWIGLDPEREDGNPTVLKLGLYGALLFVVIIVCWCSAIGSGTRLANVRIIKTLRTPQRVGWVLAGVAASILFLLLFTQFFQEFDGPGAITAPYGAIRNGLISGFEYWLGEQGTVRGDARWQYYLVLLSAYEWLAIGLAAFGMMRVLRKPDLFGQIIVWWVCASLIIHSWAGERMPWLIVHPLLPIIILAGIGLQSIWDHRKRKLSTCIVMLCVLVGSVYTCATSIYVSYVRGGEPQELFVQAGQATPEVPKWAEQLADLDRLSFANFGRHLDVSIDSDVYWPYGWYLRDFATPTYAVISADGDVPDADIIFLPHWDRSALEGSYEAYVEIPYEHRWWWVPEFDTGISGLDQFPDFLSSWGSWIWNREPWDSKSGACPASLSGSVYVKKEIYQLSNKYFQQGFLDQGEKPSYSRPCGTVSNFLTRAS